MAGGGLHRDFPGSLVIRWSSGLLYFILIEKLLPLIFTVRLYIRAGAMFSVRFTISQVVREEVGLTLCFQRTFLPVFKLLDRRDA
jgi:hypothetical protein